MKCKLFICFALLTLNIALHAQGWFTDNPKWTNDFRGFGIVGITDVTVGGDTLIQGQICKKLQSQTFEMDIDFPEDTLLFNYYSDFAYEENNRVYFYYSRDSAFHLTYDFNMEVGDTIVLTADICEPDTFVVDETGMTTINGVELRYQKWKLPIESALTKYYILEKVGFLHYEGPDSLGLIYERPRGILNLNERLDCVYSDPSPKLRCYSNDDLNYNPKNVDCQEIMRVEEVRIPYPDKVKIYPNPFQDFLKIDNTHSKINELELITVTGSNVIKLNPYATNQRFTMVNLSYLTKGIYFIKVGFEDGTFLLKKMIKL